MSEAVGRLLRRRAVEDLTGLRKSAIYKKIAEGTFPRPVPLGDAPNSPVAWPEEEIAAWRASRMTQRERRGHQARPLR